MGSISIAVEDDLSEAVLQRLLKELQPNRKIGISYPPRTPAGIPELSGWGNIFKNREAYAKIASPDRPFIVLVDLDDYECAPSLIAEWMTGIDEGEGLVFRVAVHEVESWILADNMGLADFLHIPVTSIPNDPDSLRNPKEEIVIASKKSTRAEIRSEMVPRENSTATVGPYFKRQMIFFVRELWDFSEASKISDSLNRTCAALSAI